MSLGHALFELFIPLVYFFFQASVFHLEKENTSPFSPPHQLRLTREMGSQRFMKAPLAGLGTLDVAHLEGEILLFLNKTVPVHLLVQWRIQRDSELRRAASTLLVVKRTFRLYAIGHRLEPTTKHQLQETWRTCLPPTGFEAGLRLEAKDATSSLVASFILWTSAATNP